MKNFTIFIEELRFFCIIGVLDFERKKEQEVIVNASIEYAIKKGYLDYAQVVTLIKKSMKKRKFLLLEDALLFITKKLKKKYPCIKSIHLRISKPDILPDCRVAVEYHTNFQS